MPPKHQEEDNSSEWSIRKDRKGITLQSNKYVTHAFVAALTLFLTLVLGNNPMAFLGSMTDKKAAQALPQYITKDDPEWKKLLQTTQDNATALVEIKTSLKYLDREQRDVGKR